MGGAGGWKNEGNYSQGTDNTSNKGKYQEEFGGVGETYYPGLAGTSVGGDSEKESISTRYFMSKQVPREPYGSGRTS